MLQRKGFSFSVASLGQMMQMSFSVDFRYQRREEEDGMACAMVTNKLCNAHQKEIRVEKRSPVPLMPAPAKRAGRQSIIGVPPGFPPLNSSIGKRLAAELSARAKKSKPVQESQGSRPGTAKRGQNPLVGFLPEAKFCPRFKRTFTGNPCGSLKIPKVFCQHMIGNFPMKTDAFGNT